MTGAIQNIASITTTKLRPPRQRRQLLKRERLMRDFVRNGDRRLVLVTAPAGYGKSSLLSQIYESLLTQRHRVAWINIDRDDNDLVRFYRHLWQAMHLSGAMSETLESSIVGQINGITYLPSVTALKEELLNKLSALHERLFIFFDDFHLIEEPDVLSLLGSILTASLDKVHIVIACRHMSAQPNLPLARLRVIGEVFELSSNDLAFSDDETKAFIDATGGPIISPAQAERLRKKTEGWVASLQMAAIAMRTSGDVQSFLDEFSGADRNIEDFLMEEVVLHLPQELREFLLATSILEKFNADLADFVLNRHGSRLIIDCLESLNLFLLSLDRDRIWYRYHHLFAELLQKRLNERQPESAIEYHRRAANWLEAHGYTTDAIGHAFSIGDNLRAGQLLDAGCTGLFASGQTAILKTYASKLPAEIANALPTLQLELAFENSILWNFAEAKQSLERVRQLLYSGPQCAAEEDGRDDILNEHSLLIKLEHREVMLKVITDDLVGALRAGSVWNERFGECDLFMNGSVAIAMIICRRESYDCELTLAEAETIRQQLIAAGARYGNVFLDTVMGGTSFMCGDLSAAERSLREAKRLADKILGERSTLSSMPGVQLAQVLYEEDRLEEAQQLIDECNETSPAFGVVDSVIARHLTTASLARTRRNFSDAHAALDVATHIADRYTLPRVHAHVLAERIRLLISDGQYREAERISLSRRYAEGLRTVSPSGQVDTTKEQFAIAHIRLACERGELADSINLLRRWIAWTRDRRCYRSSIRLLPLLTRLYVRAGESNAARRSLTEALYLGSSGPFIRSIIDEGIVVSELLEELLSNTASTESLPADYTNVIARAAGIDPRSSRVSDTPSPPTTEQSGALSEREIEILRLTARSLDTGEIAETLGLADSTVKWYWRKLFEKFGVHRRAAVVRLARQRGLIP
ncbi:HTH-type transcriptional regulator MalT [Paraburkholderia ultramafica]|uniref:HTH-type transcriptional regulator MalT n=1 Tax=Paraburkholderia ultramafica TaxID=1544867 RepID=A0A6S7BHH0_9BURK|nr:LuxR C-terminal-related transcriptional regulator [Paraburkholderia ultramafica]CAB3800522.1 HTH-type transcriptional regulator MalT [Paraburkholderia ultramafica]